jgi:hypothetical protein
MPHPDSKVDMAAMNAAIDKVLAYKPPSKAKQKKHAPSARPGNPCPHRQARIPHSLPFADGESKTTDWRNYCRDSHF